VRPGVLFFLLVAAVPLAGCGRGEPDVWSGPPRPDGRGSIAVDGFDGYLARHEEHATSPIVAVTRFLRLDRRAGATTSIVAHATEEGAGPTTVAVTLDRLPDDSVRAQRYLLAFTQEDGAWRLASAVATQRCWPARGHQDFSTEPCV
jgi:hypothetical protein